MKDSKCSQKLKEVAKIKTLGNFFKVIEIIPKTKNYLNILKMALSLRVKEAPHVGKIMIFHNVPLIFIIYWVSDYYLSSAESAKIFLNRY